MIAYDMMCEKMEREIVEKMNDNDMIWLKKEKKKKGGELMVVPMIYVTKKMIGNIIKQMEIQCLQQEIMYRRKWVVQRWCK